MAGNGVADKGGPFGTTEPIPCGAMGQPVRVVDSQVLSSMRTVRFEIDRSLTGQGHESYDTPGAATGRPPDELARRLFETELVSSVHIFSNLITVTLRDEPADLGSDNDDRIARPSDALATLTHAIEGLFIHYRTGVTPTPV